MGRGGCPPAIYSKTVRGLESRQFCLVKGLDRANFDQSLWEREGGGGGRGMVRHKESAWGRGESVPHPPPSQDQRGGPAPPPTSGRTDLGPKNVNFSFRRFAPKILGTLVNPSPKSAQSSIFGIFLGRKLFQPSALRRTEKWSP